MGHLFLLLLAVACVLFARSHAAYCSGSPDPNAQPNMNPIYTSDPVFVSSVPNGALYTVGDADDAIPLVHLWGSAYEKGYAHGLLRQAEAQTMISQTWQYLQDQVVSAINGTGHQLGIPQDIIDWIATVGLDVALDLTYEATVSFTNPDFYLEMQGLSDAAQIDFSTLRRIHMIGELTRGSCSMYGAWGKATASIGGKLLQLRALDWNVDGPFKNHPQITVYHSNGTASQGYTFANIGWTGWLGLITGVSANQLAVSEIGVAFPDATFGNESRIGIPFTNILRDILQFDDTYTAGLNRISSANRTCDLILGLGDGKAREFRGIEYSYSVANFFTDTDNQPVADWHPPIENIVYYGMDWLCPNYDTVLARQLNSVWGNVTEENTIRYITAITQTGDLHIAITNLDDMVTYVANARGDGESGPTYAYDRPFVRIDLKQLFSVPPPTMTVVM